MTLDELEQLVDQDAVEIFDVREPDEHADGYIPGSRNVPYRLARRCADVLDDREADRDGLRDGRARGGGGQRARS